MRVSSYSSDSYPLAGHRFPRKRAAGWGCARRIIFLIRSFLRDVSVRDIRRENTSICRRSDNDDHQPLTLYGRLAENLQVLTVSDAVDDNIRIIFCTQYQNAHRPIIEQIYIIIYDINNIQRPCVQHCIIVHLVADPVLVSCARLFVPYSKHV